MDSPPLEATAFTFFADVVDAGSFAAAARRLGVDRSNVSRRIQALERALACQLLQRSTRRMALTEAGAVLYERGCQMRAMVAHTCTSLHELTGTVSGRVTVSCPPLLAREVLAPRLALFCERYPLVQLKVKLRNDVVHLEAGKVDLSLSILHAPAPGVVARALARVDWLFCASPAYLATQPPLRQAADLSAGAWVDQSARDWVEIDGPAGVERVRVQSRLTCLDLSVVRQALLAGLGVGVLPDYIARAALQAGTLVQLLPGHRVLGTPGDTLYAITLPNRHMPAKVRAMVDFVVEMFGGDAGRALGLSVAPG